MLSLALAQPVNLLYNQLVSQQRKEGRKQVSKQASKQGRKEGRREGGREEIACSSRSDSGAREKNKVRAKNEPKSRQKRGETGEEDEGTLPQSPLFFPPFRSFFVRALFFARAPLSERLEQAREGRKEGRLPVIDKQWARALISQATEQNKLLVRL